MRRLRDSSPAATRTSFFKEQIGNCSSPILAGARELWTPRVWPGAVLVDGEVAGTWRRAGAVVTIQTWRRLSPAAREAMELEAQSFPLPDVKGRIRVRWET